MKCKDCKWSREAEHPDFKGGAGLSCDCNKFIYNIMLGWSGEDRYAGNDCLVYWDYESYSAGFAVGPEFGCIHWEPRDE